MSEKKNVILAVSGRGGAGKTTVTSIIIKLMSQKKKECSLLAVDADPPTGLTYALGATPDKTVDMIRRHMIEIPAERRRIKEARTRDVIFEEALMNANGVDLLVMGRAEGQGCFCTINEILKYGISCLAGEYDYTVIDCEAGVEQVNRRVISSIDTLLMVSDASVRGIQTAAQLIQIVSSYDKLTMPKKCVLIINKVRDENREVLKEAAEKYGMDVIGYIPVDENVIQFNLIDKPITELPDDSPSVLAVEEVLKKIDCLD